MKERCLMTIKLDIRVVLSLESDAKTISLLKTKNER